jgi:hypothetical protein
VGGILGGDGARRRRGLEMSYSVLGIASLFGGIALVVAVAMLMRRSERRLGSGSGGPHLPTAPGGGTLDPISGYLDRMTGELALPAADVDEVRAELLDHILDSVASLVAEGMDRETAIREALGRLGPAAELGRQLRAAHQSTRRLLAGAGGGVFAAGGGFFFGYIVGGFMVTAVAVGLAAIGTALGAVGLHLPGLLQDPTGQAFNRILIGFTGAIAAGAATRYAARTTASVSHRTPRSVAPVWAVAGGIGFAWWALFGLIGYQNWATIAAETCIPVAAVAGAFWRVDRALPKMGRKVLAAALIAFIVVPLGLFAVGGSGSVSVSSVGEATPYQISDLHLDTVAPMAPSKWLSQSTPFETALDGNVRLVDGYELDAYLRSDPTQAAAVPALATVLANWRDLRFEAWHALPMDQPGPGGIDTRYSSPFETRPAVLDGETLHARFDFERLRDAATWWVVLTGVGPDGARYRLDEYGMGGSADFSGSAWDWLTAPQ